jgi:hypothetical protein
VWDCVDNDVNTLSPKPGRWQAGDDKSVVDRMFLLPLGAVVQPMTGILIVLQCSNGTGDAASQQRRLRQRRHPGTKTVAQPGKI